MKRFAAVLAVAGLSLIGFGIAASPAVATGGGGSAVVGATVNGNGTVTVTSTKDLSRITAVLCVDGEIVVVVPSEDAPGKTWTFEVDGSVIAVFVHSGNNTTAAAEALLKALGGKVSGNSTGAIAFHDANAECEEEEPPTTTTTTQPPTTTTTAPPVTTTTQPPVVTTTTQPPVTTTTQPAPVVPVAPDTPVVSPPASNTPEPVAPVPTEPVGEVDELAFGGSWTTMLTLIGAGLGLLGLSLLLGFRRSGTMA